MMRKYDLVVIGTGTAASAVAYKCHAAGWEVAGSIRDRLAARVR